MEILYQFMAVLSKSLATLTATTLLLLVLISPRSQRARLYLNSLIYVSGMGICSLWGVIASIVMSLIPGQRLNINKVVARSFYYLAGTLTGFRFQVEGEEHFQTRPAVLVGNHQTGIDILYLGRIFPGYASIMAKKELKFTPLLGQFMSLSGAVFIDRKNRHDSIKAFDQVGNDMKKHNLSLWVFPEGTRSNLPFPDLLPFKKGAFHLAVQAGVPVIPVVCENYNRLFDGKTRFESGTVKIKVLPPVSTKGLGPDDVTKLTTDIRQMMLAELQKMDHDRQQADLDGTAKPERMRGLAGWIGRVVGTGSSHNRVVRRVEKQEHSLRKAGTDGRNANDYGLVTEKAKQTTSDASQLKKRTPISNIDSSTSSIGETDDDGNVLVKTPLSK